MSRPTRERPCFLPVRGCHPLWLGFPAGFRFLHGRHWPGPRSLATTKGVSVDVLSSGYLDVSVRRVCFPHLWIQYGMTLQGRVSPFGNPRIKACSRLPAAYRSVLRPSSPLSAKASTKCPTFTCSETVTRRGKPPEVRTTARRGGAARNGSAKIRHRRSREGRATARPAIPRSPPRSIPIHDDKDHACLAAGAPAEAGIPGDPPSATYAPAAGSRVPAQLWWS